MMHQRYGKAREVRKVSTVTSVADGGTARTTCAPRQSAVFAACPASSASVSRRALAARPTSRTGGNCAKRLQPSSRLRPQIQSDAPFSFRNQNCPRTDQITLYLNAVGARRVTTRALDGIPAAVHCAWRARFMATRTLAGFAVGLKPSTVPAAVSLRTQEILLDCIGNIIRARHDPASSSTPPLIVSETIRWLAL
eukprot:COSAG02_NODE_3028_length_7515_cov_4.487325_1_plen_195_part_00